MGRAWSSLLVIDSFSRKVGEGARVAGLPLEFAFAEKERSLVGVLTGEAVEGGGSCESVSIADSIVRFVARQSSGRCVERCRVGNRVWVELQHQWRSCVIGWRSSEFSSVIV